MHPTQYFIALVKCQPSLSFITNRAEAPPACAISALIVKSHSPRKAKAADLDSCREREREKKIQK